MSTPVGKGAHLFSALCSWLCDTDPSSSPWLCFRRLCLLALLPGTLRRGSASNLAVIDSPDRASVLHCTGSDETGAPELSRGDELENKPTQSTSPCLPSFPISPNNYRPSLRETNPCAIITSIPDHHHRLRGSLVSPLSPSLIIIIVLFGPLALFRRGSHAHPLLCFVGGQVRFLVRFFLIWWRSSGLNTCSAATPEELPLGLHCVTGTTQAKAWQRYSSGCARSNPNTCIAAGGAGGLWAPVPRKHTRSRAVYQRGVRPE